MNISLTKIIGRLPEWLWRVLMIAVPAALAYLPLAGKLGLYADDWYLMLAGETQGTQAFWDIFVIDRPLRAFLVGGFYALFGANAPLYSYSAYLWRVGAALALLWMLRMLWPRQRFATTLMALLFALYPGFVDQVNALDYQSHLASLFLAMLSIALSVKAALSATTRQRVILALLSGVLALLYLGLMEYYIGLEGLRFLALGLLVLRRTHGLRARTLALARAWLPFTIAPMLFLLWRVFFFANQRGATNINAMVADYAGSPVLRGLWTLTYLLRDTINTLVVAWGLPLYQTGFDLRLRDSLIAMLIALAAAGLVVLLLAPVPDHREEAGDSSPRWLIEAALLGLLGCVLALVPVAFGDRHIVFPEYSRFTLTASAGGMILLGALLSAIPVRSLRMGVIGGLVMVAVLAGYSNAQSRADETAEIRAFWWQVAWRAPGIQPGTTLVANYPTTAIVEDYFLYAPANLIYYPQKTTQSAPLLPLSAIVLDRDALISILGHRSPQEVGRRGGTIVRDYANILVISAPVRGACAQILDGHYPEVSSREDTNIMLIAEHSKIENVITQAAPLTLPATVFGVEPQHGWCYYYEKASLSRQLRDWQEAARLGDLALEQDLRPMDRVEWLPFLQAYAHTGRDEMLRSLAPILLEEPLLARQICSEARAADGDYDGVRPDIRQEIEGLFCK